MEIISAIFADIRAISGLFSDCRILEMIVIVKDIFTEEGIKKILERISENIADLLADVGEMVLAITQSDMNTAGKYIGKMLKTALDFYVN